MVVVDLTVEAVVVPVLGERDQHQSEHTQYQQAFKLVRVDLVQLKMLLVVCLVMHILQELHHSLDHQSLLLLAVVEAVSAATVKLVVLLVVEEVVVLHQMVLSGSGDPYPSPPQNSPANGWGNDGGNGSGYGGGGGGAGGTGYAWK